MIGSSCRWSGSSLTLYIRKYGDVDFGDSGGELVNCVTVVDNDR